MQEDHTLSVTASQIKLPRASCNPSSVTLIIKTVLCAPWTDRDFPRTIKVTQEEKVNWGKR